MPVRAPTSRSNGSIPFSSPCRCTASCARCSWMISSRRPSITGSSTGRLRAPDAPPNLARWVIQRRESGVPRSVLRCRTELPTDRGVSGPPLVARDGPQHATWIENHVVLFVKQSLCNLQIPGRHARHGGREQGTHRANHIALAQPLVRQKEQIHLVDYAAPVMRRQRNFTFRWIGRWSAFQDRDEQRSLEFPHTAAGLGVVDEKLLPCEPVVSIQSIEALEPDQATLEVLLFAEIEKTCAPSARQLRGKAVTKTFERKPRRLRPKSVTTPGPMQQRQGPLSETSLFPARKPHDNADTVPQRAFDSPQESGRAGQRPGVHHAGLPAPNMRLSSGLNVQPPWPARAKRPRRSLHSTRRCSSAWSRLISPATNSILSRSNGSSAWVSPRSALSASSDRPNRCRIQVAASFSISRFVLSIRVCQLLLALLLLNGSSTPSHPPEVSRRSPA